MVRARPLVVTFGVAVFYLFLLLPILIVVLISFSSATTLQFPPPGLSLYWYGRLLEDEPMRAAVATSVKVALLSTALSTLIGTSAGLAIGKYRVPGCRVWSMIFLAPLIVPYVVLAVGLSKVFTFLALRGTMLSVVLAHTTVSLPYVVVMVSTGFHMYRKSLDEAALTLGANELTTFFRITLPLLSSNILAGAFFAFVTSFDDFVLAYFLCGPLSVTLPVRIYAVLRERIDPTVSTVSTVLVFLIMLASLFSTQLYVRRYGGQLRG